MARDVCSWTATRCATPEHCAEHGCERTPAGTRRFPMSEQHLTREQKYRLAIAEQRTDATGEAL